MSFEFEDDDFDDGKPVDLPDGSTEISLDSLDDDIDDPSPKLSRQDRRRGRIKEAFAAKKELEEIRKRHSELENRLREQDEWRRNAEKVWEDERNKGKPDPFEERLQALYDAEEDLADEWQKIAVTEAGKDEDLQERYREKARNIRAQQSQLIARREMQSHMAKSNQTQSQSEATVLRTMMQQEFPDVMKNQKALLWANGYHGQQIASNRENNIGLIRESLEKAREALRTSSPRSSSTRKPSESQKSRYAGTPAMGGANESQGKSGRFVVEPWMKAMADQTFPELPADQRYSKYVKMLMKKNG